MSPDLLAPGPALWLARIRHPQQPGRLWYPEAGGPMEDHAGRVEAGGGLQNSRYVLLHRIEV